MKNNSLLSLREIATRIQNEKNLEVNLFSEVSTEVIIEALSVIQKYHLEKL